jgi:GMP synthase-like glutamine amidotransferase
MLARLLRDAGAAHWRMDIFDATKQHFPDVWADYDAVLLTGSKEDSFSEVPWVVTLRQEVTALLQSQTTLLGVCFGHQLIAYCLGAEVGRSPRGWGLGRMEYDWHANHLSGTQSRSRFALLASHQDQVLTVPPGARVLASSDFCPVAAYAIDDRVLCVQPHPEFVPEYSAYLLETRRSRFGEDLADRGLQSLALGHEGVEFAKLMVAFVEQRKVSQPTPEGSDLF